MRIIIIDDYADVRITLEAALQILGFDPCAASSSTALRVAAAFRPEVVLIDLAPYAAELLKILRQLLGPLVVIGMTNDEDRRADAELGLAGTLLKPFELDELHALLAVHAPGGGYLS